MHTPMHPRRQAGLSLIELMIAMVISLVLMAGVISVFVSSKRSYGTNTAVAQVQENARFALNFITPTIRMAGYSGCTKSINLTTILKGGGIPLNFGQGIGGYEANGTSPGSTYTVAPASTTGWSPVLDSSITGLTTAAPASLAVPPLTGSDVLVIYSTTGSPLTASPPGNTNSAIVTADLKLLSTTTALSGLYNGEIAIISDCTKGTVFQITNMNGTANVVHSKNSTYVPGNAQDGLGVSYSVGASIYVPEAYLFYVGKGADSGNSLYMADLAGGGATSFVGKELVSGIDNMQVLYGVDPVGDGTTGYYTTADAVSAAGLWQNVISVELSLLVRSASGAIAAPSAVTNISYNLLGTTIKVPMNNPGVCNTCLRHVFTTTIGLRNRLQ